MRKPYFKKTPRGDLAKDISFIALGAIAALALSYSGLIDTIVSFFNSPALASFVAGIFFTSAFTIAPAALALGHISLHASALSVTLWGALGAVCGDLIIFFFIRDRFADDIMKSLKPSFSKHILGSFHLGFLKWLAPFLGALIIASPLPDELGLTLMGLSKTRLAVLIPVAFVGNIIGIYAIVWFSSAL